MNSGVPTRSTTPPAERTVCTAGGGNVKAGVKPSLTPAMRQYLEQKTEVGDAILLFRMGDFYETFYEDAKTVSRVLGLTLTSRNKGSKEPIPLAGVPYHAVDGYIAKLVRAGYKVAISEQVEDPRLAKGVVKRRVERVITPGTLTDEALLDERGDNYLVALCPDGAAPADSQWHKVGLACVELASGRFFAQVVPAAALGDELARLRPAEVLVPEAGIADGGWSPAESEERMTNGDLQNGKPATSSTVDRQPPNHHPQAPTARRALLEGLQDGLGLVVTVRPAHVFDAHMAERALCDHFGVSSLAGFGFDSFDASLCAAAAVVDYLKETQRVSPESRRYSTGKGPVSQSALAHILKIVPRRSDRSVIIDQVALRSLEVERPLDSPWAAARGGQGRDGSRAGSLLGAIDMTVNPMGSRRLRAWLCFPLRDEEEIRSRQDAIAELRGQPDRLRRMREHLREMGDIERIAARLGVGRASPRDMVALGRALGGCAKLAEETRVEDWGLGIGDAERHSESSALNPPNGKPREASFVKREASFVRREASDETRLTPEKGCLLGLLTEALGGHEELAGFLSKALKEDAPPVLRGGGFIADGYDEELDRLREVGRAGGRWLAEFQAREVERTAIPTLKVGYNSVFGYYIEVTHTHRDKVPAEYVRKQTIRNAERYITEDLKRHENEVLGAVDKAKQLELELFDGIRRRAAADLPRVQATAEAIATLDVLCSLAELSRRRDYCRPELVDHRQSSIVLEIVDGRHPVLDVTLAERFVPNDCLLAPEGDRLLVITGPNMAGKSTYIRQVALLVLLAQTGSYVPAKSMRWSPVDRIFARVGASDELARGHSTFMVEMLETARILNNATAGSLVILDEIGRGTSTYDGLALAWAITEHIAGRIGCRTLFATHYHELTELAEQLPGVANYNVAVREQLRPEGAGRDVVFLHKITPGATDRSYGVHVAAMAGLPASVLRRSEAVLAELERHFEGKSRSGGLAAEGKSLKQPCQALLFSDLEPMPDWWRELVDAVDAVELDRTTPLDALGLLGRLQRLVKRGS
ncbi:MAG: DNA mismatch repair protein MutS [Phycisphaerae bacterium]|nr:DNA mismatch repair protein MutS [Phycisphaerae bacterium]